MYVYTKKDELNCEEWRRLDWWRWSTGVRRAEMRARVRRDRQASLERETGVRRAEMGFLIFFIFIFFSDFFFQSGGTAVPPCLLVGPPLVKTKTFNII